MVCGEIYIYIYIFFFKKEIINQIEKKKLETFFGGIKWHSYYDIYIYSKHILKLKYFCVFLEGGRYMKKIEKV
jgi:hypothetical protein